MLLPILIACNEPRVEPPPPPPPDTPLSFTLEPDNVDFGLPPLDTLATQQVLLTNTSDADLVIVRATTPAGVQADFHGKYWLSAGDQTPIDLSWTPVDPLGLQGSVHLDLDNDYESGSADLPVNGVGQGAAITLTSDHIGFGDISVGCDREFAITIANTGNLDLTIDHIDLLGNSAYTMRDIALPVVLRPFHSQDVNIEFIPRDLQPADGLIKITSDYGDPTVTLSGQGVADGESTLTFTATDDHRKMTALWHINANIIPGSYSYGPHAQRFQDSLQTYFETLQDSGSEYRVGFIWSQNGIMDGNYIDNTMSPSESVDAAFEMLDAGSYYDNDGSFTTLLNAIQQNYDWLFEDPSWEDSKLNLIAVNRDQEQSGGLWSNYLADAQAYKTDPANLVFHAIAGTPPYGCGEGTEGFQGFTDAVDATGGSFFPLCDTDWTDNMSELAVATQGGSSLFPLQGTVIVDTLEVSLDGVRTTHGWTYSPELNAIVFTPEDYPALGSTVTVHYLHPTGCG